MATVVPVHTALASSTAIATKIPSGPSSTSAQWLGLPSSPHAATPQDHRVLFQFCPATELPQVDLSRTLARKCLSTRMHRHALRFMRDHFHHLVWLFRFGAVCFSGLFYVDHGPLHDFFVAAIVPSTAALFATVLFQSTDILKLLGKSYEFWFMTTINTLNWISFASVLRDARAVMSFLGWFSFQIVISVDASFRTVKTAVNSMMLVVPIVVVLWGLVSLRAIKRGTFFSVRVAGHTVGDAAIIMGFTTSTLSILLVKMVVLKKRRTRAPVAGDGYSNLPCVFTRTTLRLVPVGSSSAEHGTAVVASTGTGTGTTISSVTASPPPPYVQRLKLSPLSITQIDAYRTLLPRRFWYPIAHSWIGHHHWVVAGLLYTLGSLGFVLLAIQTIRLDASVLTTSSASAQAQPSHHDTNDTCTLSPLTRADHTRTQWAMACSIVFCFSFTLFFQRDLLRLLVFNFDYVFSIVQVALFGACIADMQCWHSTHTLVIGTWLLWFVWALSIDALSPQVQLSSFRIPKKLAALVVCGVLLAGLAADYVVLFRSNNGLRDRVIAHVALSQKHAFDLTTKTLMIGRVATIALWCTRQVFVLFTRKDDELNLIRGLMEYESPYAMFPRKLNTHTPAINDDTSDDD